MNTWWGAVPGRSMSGWNLIGAVVIANLLVAFAVVVFGGRGRAAAKWMGSDAALSGVLFLVLLSLFTYYATKSVNYNGPLLPRADIIVAPFPAGNPRFTPGSTASLWLSGAVFAYSLAVLIQGRRAVRDSALQPS